METKKGTIFILVLHCHERDNVGAGERRGLAVLQEWRLQPSLLQVNHQAFASLRNLL